jgi:hypothetical protein
MEAKLLAKKEELTSLFNNLKKQIDDVEKELYELSPSITVTDEKSGRIFTLTKNSYEMSKKYPKVHPDTGERLYEKGAFWYYSKDDSKYHILYAGSKRDFPDKEYSDEVYDKNYNKIYETTKGWAKPGYCWKDFAGDFDIHSDYGQVKIVNKEELEEKSNKRKRSKKN